MNARVPPSGPHILAKARSWSPVAIVIAIGLVVTGIAFLTTHQAEERRVHKWLEFRVDWRAKDLETKLGLTREALLATAIHVGAQPEIDAAELSGFMSRAAGRSESIASLAWIERIRRDQRAGFEQRAGFAIVDNGANDTRVAAPEREDYAPIVVQSRTDGRPLSLGLDLSLRPNRRHAMEGARDSGVPSAVMMPERAADSPLPLTRRKNGA